MPFVDRTNDFFDAVSNVASQNKPVTRAPSLKVAQPPSTFGADASRCRELISRAERGLERMRRLGQQSGVFDDPSAEISDLATSIQQDLSQISHTIQQLSAAAGSANQSGMLAALKSSAMTITQELATALRQRAEQLKCTEQHRQAFGGSSGGSSAQWSQGGGLRARHKKSSLHVEMSMAGLDDGAADDDACVINLPSAAEMQQQHMHNPRRTAAVEGAEKMIGELATTFQKMTGLVSQQAEMLSSIDQNLDCSMDNVEKAQTNLSTFLDGITGNRSLVLKTFATLIMFAVFFFYFMR